MGILDDAIREHLDLKRRLGAEDDELTRLEGEAFGPPSRPGDPDFPDDKQQAAAAPAQAETATEAPPTEAPPEEQAVAPPAEPAAAPEPEPQAPGTAEQSAVAEDDSSAFHDHQSDELDLDLELEDPPAEASATEAAPEAPAAERPSEELSAVPETADQPAVDPTPTPTAPAAAEPPVESLDTVEHHFEGAIEDTGEAEVVEGELADEPEPAAAGEGDEDDEDVLEETPEFLRDAPEDDELWFEQGEPKDFDF